MKLKLPDGRELEVEEGRPLKEILAEREPELLPRLVGAKLDGELVDLHTPINAAGKRVELLTLEAPEAAEIYRHSYSRARRRSGSSRSRGSPSSWRSSPRSLMRRSLSTATASSSTYAVGHTC